MVKSYKQRIKYIGLFIVIIAVLYYGYYQTRDLFLGSQINISYPTNGQEITEKVVDIQGTIKNASYIYLNGKQIYTDKNNNIKENVILFEGQNFFQIKTVDKFGKEKITNIEIYHTN